ncbi:MAG TPA: hypothetical protein VME22_02520 [Solirubrobacteraceae bacterium]|nr:hypothetical protein [Solirubrobacteraceae bacterium]
MVRPRLDARYTAAMAECGGRCPIEAGVIGRLADRECRNGRLSFDRTAACGWGPQEGGVVMILATQRSASGSNREAA